MATRFCYYCGANHPEEQMRKVFTKHGIRWRCVKSLEGASKSATERDQHGKMSTEKNSKLSSLLAKANNMKT
jgi:hypothetical protein